jgi:hypothetical protein
MQEKKTQILEHRVSLIIQAYRQKNSLSTINWAGVLIKYAQNYETLLEENIALQEGEKQKLPLTLQQKITEFLRSLPDNDDTFTRRTLIYRAGLDTQLQNQISLSGSPKKFVPQLVVMLSTYGVLEDGRDPLEAILEAAKDSIGKHRQAYCDKLIQELREIKK